MAVSTTQTTKGERTRAAILGEALRLVSKAGLDGLTIGTLADATGMSKSGLFAHFGSREELLLAVLAHGQAEFNEVVFQPALARPRGLPQGACTSPALSNPCMVHAFSRCSATASRPTTSLRPARSRPTVPPADISSSTA